MARRIITVVALMQYPVRDTSTHFPDFLIPLDKATAWGAEVVNTTGVNINIAPIGGTSPWPAAVNTLAASQASSQVVTAVSSNIAAQFFGVQFSMASAPTAGFVTIKLWRQVEVPDEEVAALERVL